MILRPTAYVRRLAAVIGVVVLALSVGACSAASSDGTTTTPAKAGTCLDMSQPSIRPTTAATIARGAGDRLPALTLPCSDGSGDVRLTRFSRPTIITLWASWCQPCRAELPAINAFAAANSNAVNVIGVDTADTHTGGNSEISDLRLSFPSVFDPDRKLLLQIGRINLPVTLFVGTDGTVRAVWAQAGLDAAHLSDWSQRYLGIVVKP